MAARTRPSANGTRSKASINDVGTFKATFDSVMANITAVVRGKDDIVRLALVAILCEGHVLFEDLPGTGKSMLARAIGASINAQTTRVQCTPDMLPGDITGSSIYDQRHGEFEFRPGPVFTNVLLADEINRATPKTQSALLEAMAERRVSADGVTYELPRPFLVLATQNPIEQAGTFPLPEAQLDRFLFKLSMGYLSFEAEFDVMIDNAVSVPIDRLSSVIEPVTVVEMIEFAAARTEVSQEVGGYIVHLVQATRQDPAIAVGGSPRATIALLKAARVLAATDGRSHVYPDDVREAARPVLAHRMVLEPEGVLRGETVDTALDRVLATVKPPLAPVGG